MVNRSIFTAVPALSLYLIQLKEVIGVLLIESIFEPNNMKSDHVKCPACKRGRLCDKPIGEKAMAIAIQGDSPRKRSNGVILKCPKCSKQFLISLTKE